jgi:non-heme chloroperoxidase
LLVKTTSNPDGIPIEVFDGLRAELAANRSATYWDFTMPFYGYNREGAPVNERVRLNWWRQAMTGGALPQYECIEAFSETDFSADLRSIEVPVFIMHGEDDQIVPIAISALRAAKLVERGTLKTYPGLPHGMCTTHADRINADLLAFIES